MHAAEKNWCGYESELYISMRFTCTSKTMGISWAETFYVSLLTNTGFTCLSLCKIITSQVTLVFFWRVRWNGCHSCDINVHAFLFATALYTRQYLCTNMHGLQDWVYMKTRTKPYHHSSLIFKGPLDGKLTYHRIKLFLTCTITCEWDGSFIWKTLYLEN